MKRQNREQAGQVVRSDCGWLDRLGSPEVRMTHARSDGHIPAPNSLAGG